MNGSASALVTSRREYVCQFKVSYSETHLLLALCVLSGCNETGLGTDSLSFPNKPFSFKDFSF